MDLQKLSAFLECVNKETYANKSAAKAVSLRPSSEDYHFVEGNLTYHDTYFGSRDFIGEEVIYENGKPVWAANYYGFVLKSDISEKEVYDFLRQALMQPSAESVHVRGPKQFSASPWEYTNRIEGNLDRFSGTETILLNGEEVYRCLYHGGLIR